MESHLLQMRGLKQFTCKVIQFNQTSHLLQMRGLKLLSIACRYSPFSVASFTDAWIETHL